MIKLAPAAAVQPAFDTIEVFDADTKSMVVRTPDQQRLANTLLRAAEAATLVKAVALARLVDGKHYLDFGFSTFKEFAEMMLPVGYRSAQMYTKIGRKFAPLLPGFESSEAKPVSLLGESTGENGQILQVGGLGMRKLLDLTRVDDAIFADIVEEGRLVMPDGHEYSIDELKAMAVKEFEKTLSDAREDKEAYRARNQQLQEQIKLLESERETDAKKLADADAKLQEAEQLERLYGPAAKRYSDVHNQLSHAQFHAQQLRRFLFNAEVSESDSQVLIDLLQSVVAETGATFTRARSYYAHVLDLAEDTILDSETDAMWDDILSEREGEVVPGVVVESELAGTGEGEQLPNIVQMPRREVSDD